MFTGITADRIRDYRAALRACLARNCPTNEDIDAAHVLTPSATVRRASETAASTAPSPRPVAAGAATATSALNLIQYPVAGNGPVA
mgnify:CR=1 FL=1